MDNRLEQAIRTLRAIRQRYETESDAGSERRRSYTVQVALGYADMRWIGATIEALEKTTLGTLGADSSGHPAAAALADDEDDARALPHATPLLQRASRAARLAHLRVTPQSPR